MKWFGPKDSNPNPYHGADSAGGCGRGCLHMMLIGIFVLMLTGTLIAKGLGYF